VTHLMMRLLVLTLRLSQTVVSAADEAAKAVDAAAAVAAVVAADYQ